MELLFSYGTLQKDDVQLKLFGRLLKGDHDVLNGYQLSSIEIKDPQFLAGGEDKIQLTVIPSPGDHIKGMVFEISKQELLQADSYEPENYKRIEVMLASGKKAWIYAAT